MGAEMLYILDQRLRAQIETQDKARKGWLDDDRKRVLNDIASTMFSKAFLEELMKPQDLYSHQALYCVLTRLAHTSIMRLNPANMNRLYDLIRMAFKYQLILCPRPKYLLHVSFNHMDGVRELVKDNTRLVHQINGTQHHIMEMFTPLSDGEFQLIRQTLLALFQDVHIRMSLFLKDKLQNPDGRFVLPTSGPVPQGSSVPGLIRYFNSRGREVKRRTFSCGALYTGALQEGSFDKAGDRVTSLGTNMYNVTSSEDTHSSGTARNICESKQFNKEPNPLATEELNLLAKLLGKVEVCNCTDGGIRVNLFPSDVEEDEGRNAEAPDETIAVLNIQAAKDHEAETELARIAAEFTYQSKAERTSNKGDDLLSMMDEL